MRFVHRTILALSLVAAVANADCTDLTQSSGWLGAVYSTQVTEAPVGFLGLAVAGDHAYLIQSGYGLIVVDISIPTAPSIAGGVRIDALAWEYRCGIAVRDDYCYIAADDLLVVDVQDPTNPVVVAVTPTPGPAVDVAAVANRLVVADDTAGLIVHDLSDPVHPLAVSSQSLGGAWITRLVVHGDLAFVGTSQPSTLTVLSLPIDQPPTVVAATPLAIAPYDISISGQRALITSQDGGGLLLDVTSPAAPVVLGALPVASGGALLDGNTAWVGSGLFDWQGRLLRFDVTDPSTPLARGADWLVGGPQRLALVEGTAWVAELCYHDYSQATLEAFDRRRVEPLVPPATMNWGASYLNGMVRLGGSLVAAAGPGLRTADVSDPQAPRLTGAWPLPDLAGIYGPIGDVVVLEFRDDHLHQWFETRRVDPSGAVAPALLAAIVLPDDGRYRALCGDVLAVAFSTGLALVDLEDPVAPVTHATGYPWNIRGVAGDGHRLLVETSAAVHLIDVGNPAAPYLLGSWPFSGARAGALHGNVAAVSISSGSTILLDWSDPTRPEQIGLVPRFSWQPTLNGNLLFLPDELRTWVYDLEDPAVPQELGYFPGYLGWPGIDGEELLACDTNDGDALVIYPAPCRGATATPEAVQAASPTLMSAPNPANPRTTIAFALTATSRIFLSVYDSRGRLVRVLADGLLDAGRHRVVWDGRDTAGRPVATGTYLARLTAAGETSTVKVCLVR